MTRMNFSQKRLVFKRHVPLYIQLPSSYMIIIQLQYIIPELFFLEVPTVEYLTTVNITPDLPV